MSSTHGTDRHDAERHPTHHDDHLGDPHGHHHGDESPRHVAADRGEVVAREKDAYGGVKWGSAFLGWLAALGATVFLTALLSAIGAAVGLGTGVDGSEADLAEGTVGLTALVAVLVLLFVAYAIGGYVAGRMARFDGAKQGLAVWFWAVVVAVVVAALALVAGTQYDVPGDVDVAWPLPVDGGTLSTAGILAAVAALVVSLVGAVVGGLAGMRYHRKVDRAGLGR